MRRAAWFVLAAGIAAAGGCGSKGRHATVNTGLNTMLRSGAASGSAAAPAPPKKVDPPTVANSNLAELLKQQAVDTQRILAGLDKGTPAPQPAVGAASAAGPAAMNAAPGPGAGKGTDAGAPTKTVAGPAESTPAAEAPAATPGESEPAPPPAAKTLPQRIDETAVLLIDLLRQQSAEQPSMRTLAALAGMEAVRPGAAQQVFSASSGDSAVTPAQQAAVEALRDAAAAVTAASDKEWTGPEAGALADRLGEIADRVGATQPLRVREARLCTRVSGFGRYTPFGDGANRVVAGRPQRAIVYVEVDRFAHREIGDGDETLSSAREQGDRWAVELTQEINLYSDAGNLLVLRHPPERVLETSRARRRDFYLVREIALPPTLGAGRYNLKVTLRDTTSGALAESVIPIEVVADAALTRPR